MKYLLTTLSLFLMGCASAQKCPKENLSSLRPQVEPKEIDISDAIVELEGEAIEIVDLDKLPMVTESKKEVEVKVKELAIHYEKARTKKAFKGYRVQVFSTNNKTKAERVMREIRAVLSQELDSKSPMVYNLYDQPFFRVKIGDYLLKERAHELLYIIQQVKGFENALLVPDLIKINRID